MPFPGDCTLPLLAERHRGIAANDHSRPVDTPSAPAENTCSADASFGATGTTNGAAGFASGGAGFTSGAVDASFGTAGSMSGAVDASFGTAGSMSGTVDAPSSTADASSGAADVPSVIGAGAASFSVVRAGWTFTDSDDRGVPGTCATGACWSATVTAES